MSNTKKRIFTGAGVAVITPMNPDGSVNFTKLGELIDRQIENKTDAIIICGTTGESAALNHEEHIECIKFAVNHTNKRVPVIAGAGSNDTNYGVKLAKEAEDLGADALLVVTPYYNKTSQRGIVTHYNLIADSVRLPIIVYNVPSRTGLNIMPATYKELSKHENITAIKEASGNISAVAETRYLCGDDLDIYSGNDDQIVPAMSLGGIGVISVLSNVMPREVHDICEMFLKGRIDESAGLQIKLMPFINALFSDVNPVPVKAAMNLMGFEVGECRLPLVDMTIEAKSKMADIMKNLSLL